MKISNENRWLNPLMIKISSFLIAAAICIPLVSASAGLNDIAGDKHETAIQYLFQNSIISGYSDGTFKPDNTVNRAELLKILVGANGVTPSVDQYNNCFPDVTTEWFAPYVCYAKTQGWVQGYADNTFRPAQVLNKVEALKMLDNSQGYTIPTTVSGILFDDVDNSQWYAPYIKAAKDKGLLDISSGSYGVTQQMQRGEISENIYRAILLKKSGTTANGEYYQVVKVVDGDTIDVNMDGETVRLRLIGIDTPETVDPNKPVQCYGPEASAKAKEMLMGQYVLLEADPTQGDTDKYGRLLRYVILEDNTNFELWMIENGYAHEYTYDKPYKYQDEFKAAETKAKANGLGLWGEDTCNGTTTSVTPVDTQEQGASGHLFYVSSQARSKYYCDTDPAWKNLAPANLLTYTSEEALKKDFPNLTLHEPCK